MDSAVRSHATIDFPRCAQCDYNLRGLGSWPIRCPECGTTNLESNAQTNTELANEIFSSASWTGTLTVVASMLLGLSLTVIFAGTPALPLVLCAVVSWRAYRSFAQLRQCLRQHSIRIAHGAFIYGVFFAVDMIGGYWCAVELLARSILNPLVLPVIILSLALLKKRDTIIERIRRSLCVADVS